MPFDFTELGHRRVDGRGAIQRHQQVERVRVTDYLGAQGIRIGMRLGWIASAQMIQCAAAAQHELPRLGITTRGIETLRLQPDLKIDIRHDFLGQRRPLGNA